MGCDIHLHIEIMFKGKWEHWGAPKIDRFYKLFSVMAGVRRGPEDPQPIALPKGLPEGLSTVTQFAWEQDKLDAHSASWFGLFEIKELEHWWFRSMPAMDSYLFEDKCLHTYLLGNTFGAPKDPVQDVRFVFWFDN